jgi:hypothetical protein
VNVPPHVIQSTVEALSVKALRELRSSGVRPARMDSSISRVEMTIDFGGIVAEEASSRLIRVIVSLKNRDRLHWSTSLNEFPRLRST